MRADVVLRTVEVVEASTGIGCRGLPIHEVDAEARASYLRALPDLKAGPLDPMRLIALVKDLRRSLESKD